MCPQTVDAAEASHTSAKNKNHFQKITENDKW